MSAHHPIPGSRREQFFDAIPKIEGLSTDEDQDYCGCCGNECGEGYLWCVRCSWHVLDEYLPVIDEYVPIWNRTWFAQHGTDCPYQSPVPTVGAVVEQTATSPQGGGDTQHGEEVEG